MRSITFRELTAKITIPASTHTRPKLLSKGEWRSPVGMIDTIRFWGGVTDYKHNELGLADDTNPASDGIRQTFTNQEQEARVEAQLRSALAGIAHHRFCRRRLQFRQ